jgi:MscS family membrane protein
MSGFGSHSLDVMLYFFFEVPSWSVELRERHNVFLEIMRLAEDLKVTFAFPTQTLLLDYVNAPGRERHVPKPPPEPQLEDHVRAFGPEGDKARPRGPRIIEDSFAARPDLSSHYQG